MLLVLAIVVAVIWLPSPWNWVLVGVAVVVEFAEVLFWLGWRGRRARTKVGAETLIGEVGTVTRSCRPDGQVALAGEIWSARCASGAGEGQAVRVTAIDGLILIVTPEHAG